MFDDVGDERFVQSRGAHPSQVRGIVFVRARRLRDGPACFEFGRFVVRGEFRYGDWEGAREQGGHDYLNTRA